MRSVLRFLALGVVFFLSTVAQAWYMAPDLEVAGPPRCQTLLPGLQLCGQMLTSRSDVNSHCQYIGIEDPSVPKQFRAVVEYDILDKPKCGKDTPAGVPFPSFQALGPEEVKHLSGGKSISYRMVKNLSDGEGCLWFVTRDALVRHKAGSLNKFIVNKKQVCIGECTPGHACVNSLH